jgi:cytochrome c peroxidase
MRAWLAVALCGLACGGPAVTPEPSSCEWPELTAAQCDDWKRAALGALPAARGNRLGDDEAAAELGYQLFFDLDVLSPGLVRCASCHVPEQGFTTHVAQPRGRALLPRNALSLFNAARTYPHFWDGRVDSLWAQALSAIENPAELGGDRLQVVHGVTTRYPTLYAAAFGAVPDLSGLPATTASWGSLSAADQRRATAVFVNVGKALEAYVRRLARGPAAVDRFLGGDASALSARQRRGFALFASSGCLGCHAGPNLSDGRFHRLDVPLPTDAAGSALAAADRGRSAGLETWLGSEFNALSDWFDRPAGTTPVLEGETTSSGDGFFLTPSLRNVTLTGPWGHDGAFASLESVVRFHLAGGGPGCTELMPRALSDEEVGALVEFFSALEGEAAPARWTSWPGAYVGP